MGRKVYESEGHAHFVTFSCYRRRRILDDDRVKSIVVHFPADELQKTGGSCTGFVIMPDHVQALVHFGEPGISSRFIQQWKRKSSHRLKKLLEEHLPAHAATMDLRDPIWQAGFYDFNLFSTDKAREKLECGQVDQGAGTWAKRRRKRLLVRAKRYCIVVTMCPERGSPSLGPFPGRVVDPTTVWNRDAGWRFPKNDGDRLAGTAARTSMFLSPGTFLKGDTDGMA